MKKPGPIPPHLIEQSWEQYCALSAGNGAPPPDKLSYLCGFAGAIGVLVGTVDCGIPQGTYMGDVIAQLLNVELPKYRAEIAHLEAEARRRMN